MPGSRPWTRDDLRWLRRFRRDRVPLADVADVLGRTVGQVRAAVQRYRIRQPGGRTLWTPAEDAVLLAEYRTTPAPVLAARLGRGLSGVYRRAEVLMGKRIKTHRWGAAVFARFRRLHAEGLPDRVIGETLGMTTDQAKAIRRERLKLPCNPDRESKRRGVQKQLKTLGLTSPVQLRTRAFRRFAERRGWPPDLRPREVQILEVLAAGPLTRRQLAEALGLRAIGARNALKSSSGAKPGAGEYKTTYLSELMGRGLVTYQNRSEPTGRQGHGRLPGLYWLTPAALDVMINRVKPTEGEDGTGQQSQPA